MTFAAKLIVQPHPYNSLRFYVTKKIIYNKNNLSKKKIKNIKEKRKKKKKSKKNCYAECVVIIIRLDPITTKRRLHSKCKVVPILRLIASSFIQVLPGAINDDESTHFESLTFKLFCTTILFNFLF